MRQYAYESLFKQTSIPKELTIKYANGTKTISNTQLNEEDFTLYDTLSSEKQFQFGSCESAYIQFTVGYGEDPLEGQTLVVSTTPEGGTPFLLGTFKVVSDTPTADRKRRTVIAYDKMKELLEMELIDWYNSLFPTDASTLTGKQFRDSLFTYLGIQQVIVGMSALPIDSATIRKTVQATSLSGRDVLTAICSASMVFGHITYDGKFAYIWLQPLGESIYPEETLYPKSTSLYPQEGDTDEEVGAHGTYIDAKFEDYYTARIDKFQVRQSENDVGLIIGTGTNAYILQDNFLLYGMSSQELQNIYGPPSQPQYTVLQWLAQFYFTPANIVAQGNPCLEVGDRIKVRTKYATIDTYIFQRTLKGINALRDTYISQSPRLRSEQLNTVNHSLQLLRGKSNELTRTIEETNSRISAVEVDLDDNYYTKTETNSEISQTADTIRTEVSNTYTTQTTFNTTVENLQDQIDDNIESFTGSAVPTLSNYPANEWTTATEKDKHLGDLYMVNSSGGDYAGFYYRFEKNNNVYGWTLLKDTEITKALQDSAQALADVSDLETDLSTNYYDKTGVENYADGVGANAITTADGHTDTKLTNYYTKTQTYTKTETNSAIEQSSVSIKSTVSSSFSKYDEKNYGITLYGFGLPVVLAQDHNGEYYLNQSNGYLYLSSGSAWSKVDELELITDEISSTIEQTTSSLQSEIKDLQGDINYYEREGIPTLLNYPYWDFTTSIPVDGSVQLGGGVAFEYTIPNKKAHESNLCIDTITKKGYRFEYDDTQEDWEWKQLQDDIPVIINRVTTIKQDLDNIELRVQNTENGISQNTAQINIQADEIESKVSKNEIISSINQSAESITIQADKINLNGAVTANNNVTIDTDGYISAIGATLLNAVLKSEYSANYRIQITNGVLRTYDSENKLGLSLGQQALTFYGYGYTPASGGGYADLSVRRIANKDYLSLYANNIDMDVSFGYWDGDAKNALVVSRTGVTKHGYTAHSIFDSSGFYSPRAHIDYLYFDGTYITSNRIIMYRADKISNLFDIHAKTSSNETVLSHLGSSKITFASNGSGTLNGTWYGTLSGSSDKRLKKDIEDLQDSVICAIGKVELKQFVFINEDYGKTDVISIGAIAQDVIKAFEDENIKVEDYGIVTKCQSKKVDDEDNESTEYYHLNYTEFLIARNAYLEKRVDELEGRIKRLEELVLKGDK